MLKWKKPNSFQIDCGLIKRPFKPAAYWPNLLQGRQRRAEALPFDSAEMNLDAANELMADILKVISNISFIIFITCLVCTL